MPSRNWSSTNRGTTLDKPIRNDGGAPRPRALRGVPARLPLCALGSLLIEVLQWAFGTGVPQVEDVLLNTFGAALGYALFRVVHSATRRPAADESHAESAEGAEN